MPDAHSVNVGLWLAGGVASLHWPASSASKGEVQEAVASSTWGGYRACCATFF